MLEKGQIVTIYEDPITQKKPEGKAKLIKRHHIVDNMEYWQVEFLDEKGAYRNRHILGA